MSFLCDFSPVLVVLFVCLKPSWHPPPARAWTCTRHLALVSFLLPVFNKAKYLGTSIPSIANLPSDPGDRSIICVDDGSRDSSVAQIVAFQRAIQNLWLFRHSVSRGTHAARISCVSAVMTRWMVFLDPDDRIVGNGSLVALEFAQKHDADIVQFGCLHVRTSRLDPGHNLSNLSRCWGDGAVRTATGRQLMKLIQGGGVDWHLHRKVFRTEVYRTALARMPDHVKLRRNSRGQDLLHYLWVLSSMTKKFYFVDDVGELWFEFLPDNSAGSSYQTSIARHRECIFIADVVLKFFHWRPGLAEC